MKQDYNFDVDKIKSLSNEEKVYRKKYLNIFLKTGFPNKQIEDWKFTDLNAILNKNFDKITNNFKFDLNKKFKILENFEHNYILLNNGMQSKSYFVSARPACNIITVHGANFICFPPSNTGKGCIFSANSFHEASRDVCKV